MWLNVQINMEKEEKKEARKLFVIFINYGQLYVHLEVGVAQPPAMIMALEMTTAETTPISTTQHKELELSRAFNINKLYKLKVNIRRLDIILSLIVLARRIGSM